jgi:Phasin protein
METKGRRASRTVRPPRTPIPQAAPTQAPVQILPAELAEPSSATAPAPPDVVVERVPPMVPAQAAVEVLPAELAGTSSATAPAAPDVVVQRVPPLVPAQAPVEVLPAELAEPSSTIAPAAPDVVVERVPPTVPAQEPVEVLPAELAEVNSATAPAVPDMVVQRISPMVPAITASRSERVDFGCEAFAALEESRAAVARELDALSDEIACLARCGIDTTARTAIEMLAVKTFSDAIAVNASFARASFENWLDGSAKFSELGVKLAIASSRPFLSRLGQSWSLAPRVGS